MTTTISTAVPTVNFSTSGLDVPDEADILAGRLTDLSVALGTSMSKELSTPQGQIAVSDSAIIADKNNQLLAIVNNINPDFSSGRFQDGIGRIYFIDRNPAVGTIVDAICSGSAKTLIPAGSLAQDDRKNIYRSLNDAEIGENGMVRVEFQNLTTGPIPCPIGKLSSIYQAVPGWSGITNDTAGILGSDVESRSAFEYRRRQSVAKNARNTLSAVYAAILGVENVTDAYVTDNKTGYEITKGGVTIPPHTMYFAVYGGKDADIAKAIERTAPPGIDMYGNTSFVTKDNTNYQYPFPEYTWKWERPKAVRTFVYVTIQQNDDLPSTIIDDIKGAVMNAFSGDDGGLKARIGSLLSAGRFYPGIQNIAPAVINIVRIELTKAVIDSSHKRPFGSSIMYDINEMPSLDINDIEVDFTSS